MDKLALAERQFKKAAALAPRDYDASHNLGEFYVRSNKVPRPSRFSNGRSGLIHPRMTTATIWLLPTLHGAP